MNERERVGQRAWLGLFALGLAACSEPQHPEPATWQAAVTSPRAALMSVHGRAADDVWLVGSDHGAGPEVLHWDGTAFSAFDTHGHGDLWWVHAAADGSTYFAGANANIFRLKDQLLERMPTPGLGKHTVYGVWAAAADDVYAVGSTAGRNGFIWHYDGQTFSELALPAELPQDEYRDTPSFFKVWGNSPESVWVVGGRGVVLRGNASAGFAMLRGGDDSLLYTVHASADRALIVGAGDGGIVLETDTDGLVDRTPQAAPLLQGACVAGDGSAWVTGLGGSIYHEQDGQLRAFDPGVDFDATQSLHATWLDPGGGFWAVGGHVLTPELDAGIAIHGGSPITPIDLTPPDPEPAHCPADAVDPAPDASIARRWNEQLLNAIRRDTPRPTVHARNLFHASVAMWDAFAAYDDTAVGYVTRERVSGGAEQREQAISYAAYRVLSQRYAHATGGALSQACFDAFFSKLGLEPGNQGTEGDTPAALGNRVAAAVLNQFHDDGANEATNYAPSEPFSSDEPNLVVDIPGTRTQDPLHWQKLVLAQAITQNGIAQGAGAQDYVGPHWGAVTPFSLVRPDADSAYLDIAKAPTAIDDELVDAVVDVLEKGAQLDIADDVFIDISPAAYGNNPLGTNSGQGYPENPVTHQPYAPERVRRGDFARVLAEFWADGPKSETPPGHWNTIANQITEHPAFTRKLWGRGPELDALSWDVHTYLALNGALHDAAIAAWELKRRYATARPITLVRYLAALGQRSDPAAPSYNPDGLPLIPNLIELITEESSAPGQRHAHLARYVGELAIRAWRGEPGDRSREHGGVDFIRAAEWAPYQRRTFVTPAFPGYVSGHSTFSRAAATVLASLTGTPYFPGGLGTFSTQPGYLVFEQGPSESVELEWATYYDAADQAGQSRLFGGIHHRIDDFDGRRIGARVGESAVTRATSYFDGSAEAQ